MTFDRTADDRPVLLVPARIAVDLTCPSCGAVYTIPATIGARVVRDDDGAGSLAVRLRAAKVPHICAQLALELDAPRREVEG